MSRTTRSGIPAISALLLLLGLAGCAAAPEAGVEEPAPVGQVVLQRSADTPPQQEQLELGIVVFELDEGSVPETGVDSEVFAEIQENERHLLPYLLRSALLEANQWGAIRVIPEADPSLDLLIEGRILVSDGRQLRLHIQAQDSTGRLWLDRVFRDETTGDDFPEATAYRERRRSLGDFEEPFADLYRQVANELRLFRAGLDREALAEIPRVSLMRYAADLSPEAFAHMLTTDAQGRRHLRNLPAENDPMLERVRDMRERHHLFIDTVDQYYGALHRDTRAAYVTWRRYSFDQLQEQESAAQRAQERRSSGSAGFQALRQRYDRYRWDKIYQQEFQDLAAGFSNETAPAILETNSQVYGLSGTMAEQYGQWRRTLRRLFLLENDSPAS